MARKIIDSVPVITLRPKFHGTTTHKQALSARDDLLALIKTHILPHASDVGSYCRGIDLDYEIENETVCEHCNGDWTEDSADYNGGCCGKDEANNPERLAALQTLIGDVEGGDFYRYDADRGRDRAKVDWPWALACAADAWLKAGRPADQVDRLTALIGRVKATDWCTLWEDPGPSGCSLARLADRVEVDVRPGDLADELTSLLDDLGLLPAKPTAVTA